MNNEIYLNSCHGLMETVLKESFVLKDNYSFLVYCNIAGKDKTIILRYKQYKVFFIDKKIWLDCNFIELFKAWDGIVYIKCSLKLNELQLKNSEIYTIAFKTLKQKAIKDRYINDISYEIRPSYNTANLSSQ